VEKPARFNDKNPGNFREDFAATILKATGLPWCEDFAEPRRKKPEKPISLRPDNSLQSESAAGCNPSSHDAAARPEEVVTLFKRLVLRNFLFVTTAFATLLVPTRLTAQEPGNVPETKSPPPAQTAPPAAPADDYATKRNIQLKEDWPWLGRFKEADMKLAPPAPGENRVVFMGDSITEGWKIEGPDGFFPGKPYINRGISGQTAPQMVLRFRQDVIDLKPKVVVILAGTNDIAGNTGPETIEEIEGYLTSMAELALANHIRVVLCSVLPASDFPWKPGLEPAPKIEAINSWLKAYAADHHHVYVDYHAAMKDNRDGLPANLSHDGVHPNKDGYAIMTPLVEAGIQKTLK
jgi:acyl-CoA thioesterase-1